MHKLHLFQRISSIHGQHIFENQLVYQLSYITTKFNSARYYLKHLQQQLRKQQISKNAATEQLTAMAIIAFVLNLNVRDAFPISLLIASPTLLRTTTSGLDCTTAELVGTGAAHATTKYSARRKTAVSRLGIMLLH